MTSSVLLLLAIVLIGVSVPSRTAVESPAKFAGSGECAQCHQEIFTHWKQSDHHKAMQPASKDTVLGNFNGVKVKFHDVETRFFKEDGGFKVSTSGVDGRPAVFTIKYTFGHYPLQQYLIDIGKGHLQALEYFARAVTQPGSSSRHVYVYAVALDSRGQTDAAMKVIEEAGERWPNNFDLSFLQVSYMDKSGNTDGIHTDLSLLAAVAVNNPQVKAWTKKYGGQGARI